MARLNRPGQQTTADSGSIRRPRAGQGGAVPGSSTGARPARPAEGSNVPGTPAARRPAARAVGGRDFSARGGASFPIGAPSMSPTRAGGNPEPGVRQPGPPARAQGPNVPGSSITTAFSDSPAPVFGPKLPTAQAIEDAPELLRERTADLTGNWLKNPLVDAMHAATARAFNRPDPRSTR